MRRIGIGALFGLHDDWRYEAIAVAAHARFLMKRYWRSQVAVSVPRMRPSASGYQPRTLLGDRDLVQLIGAMRLTLPDAGIVLSAREDATLRDGLFQVGVTHTSAGSHTDPGGYEHPDEATEQFEVADTRSPREVAAKLRELGYDPVWEDWSRLTPSAEVDAQPRARGSLPVRWPRRTRAPTSARARRPGDTSSGCGSSAGSSA